MPSHSSQLRDVVRLSARPPGKCRITWYTLEPFCGGHVNSGGVCVTIEQSAGRTGASSGSERTRMSEYTPQAACDCMARNATRMAGEWIPKVRRMLYC